MSNYNALQKLSKEQLIELISIYAKNCLAMDGVWFQSIERKHGMDEAMYHDIEAWRAFTVIETKKIKSFLQLPEQAGLEGLREVLAIRFYGNINKDETIIEGNTLIYRTLECRVQNARTRKNLDFHPCKPVGLVEYEGVGKTVDSRISCECIS